MVILLYSKMRKQMTGNPFFTLAQRMHPKILNDKKDRGGKMPPWEQVSELWLQVSPKAKILQTSETVWKPRLCRLSSHCALDLRFVSGRPDGHGHMVSFTPPEDGLSL